MIPYASEPVRVREVNWDEDEEEDEEEDIDEEEEFEELEDGEEEPEAPDNTADAKRDLLKVQRISIMQKFRRFRSLQII